MSQSKRKVIDVIKNYVNRCGGAVLLEYLLEDYKTAYHSHLPFTEFGYSSVEDFLITINGIIICEYDNGNVYVEYSEYNSGNVEQPDYSPPNKLDDLTELSVQMKNTVLLDCHKNARTVKIQSSKVNTNYKKVPSRTNCLGLLSNHCEEIGNDMVTTSGSEQPLGEEVHPRNDSLPSLDNYSTYEHSQDNLSGSCGNNYSLFENLQPVSHEPHPIVDVAHFQRERFEGDYIPEVLYQTASGEHYHKTEKIFHENIYTPDTQHSSIVNNTTDFLKPYANSYPMNVTNDIFKPHEEAYASVYTPDAYDETSKSYEKMNASILASITNQSIPSMQYVSKPQSAYIPNMYQSAPRDVSTTSAFPSSLPANNNIPTIPPTFMNMDPMLPTNSFIKTKPQDMLFMNGSSDWISNEMYRPSLRTNWPHNLRDLTDNEITDRVVKLVNSQKQIGGIDSSAVELKYKEKYSTTLPKKWLSLLEEQDLLYVEKLASCSVVYPYRYFPVPPTRTSLPALRYPSIDCIWNVYVSHFENITCVWFRLKDEDFDLKYEILKKKMNEYYPRVLEIIQYSTQVSPGQLCAVNYRNEWSRGEVLENDLKDRRVRCMLLDEGIIQNFQSEKIYPLHEKFTNTPPLILHGQLYSLGKWKNCNYVNCKILQYLKDEPNVMMKIHEFLNHNTVSMQIYLGNHSKKVDLNSKMADHARTELELPILYTGQTHDVIILSLAGSNTVQVQIKSPSLRMLRETLQKVTNIMKDDRNLEQAKVKTISDIETDKIYLARCEDGTWKRIWCTEFLLPNKVLALFIDFAEKKNVYLHDIFETSVVQDTVCFIEPQAVLIKVLDVDVVALRCLMQVQTQLTVKISYVMKVLQAGIPPLVQLYGKIPESSEPIPITNIFSSLKFDIPRTSSLYQ